MSEGYSGMPEIEVSGEGSVEAPVASLPLAPVEPTSAGPAAGWTWEEHQLSEGFSCIVYDEHGQRIADHLTVERARLICAAPDMAEACERIIGFSISQFATKDELIAECKLLAKAALSGGSRPMPALLNPHGEKK